MAVRIVEFHEYDVVVPFVCHRCGNCCRNFYPTIEMEMLPESAAVLGMSIEAIQAELGRRCDAHNAGRPVDCLFLAPEGDGCMIHSFKPECCIMFPSLTETGAGKVDCPGHREFLRVVKALSRRDARSRLRGASALRQPRPIPGGERAETLGILEQTGTSARMMQLFSELNGI